MSFWSFAWLGNGDGVAQSVEPLVIVTVKSPSARASVPDRRVVVRVAAGMPHVRMLATPIVASAQSQRIRICIQPKTSI